MCMSCKINYPRGRSSLADMSPKMKLQFVFIMLIIAHAHSDAQKHTAKRSISAKRNKVQRQTLRELAESLSRNVFNQMHSSSPLTEDIRGFLGSELMKKVDENEILNTLSEEVKKTIKDEYVNAMDDVSRKPLSRIGVLTALGKLTRQEINESRNHLRETIIHGIRKHYAVLHDLQYVHINELVEIMMQIRDELAEAGKERMVHQVDDIRRQAAKSPNYESLEQWLRDLLVEKIKENESKLRNLKENQVRQLVKKIAKVMQENTIMPISTFESLKMLTASGTNEQAERENQARKLITSWTEEKGSVLGNLTTDNKDQLVLFMVELTKSVVPETLEKTRKLVEEWSKESGSKIASLSTNQSETLARVTGLLHQTVWSVIHSNTPLTEDVRKSLGQHFKVTLEHNCHLESDQENELMQLYVAKMNEIRMEPLTRMGVLSMLGNPTPDELKEFRNQLKWIILGWTMIPESPISNLSDKDRTEVAEVLVNLRQTYADMHRKPIQLLVEELLLSNDQTSYVTDKLVKYGDDMRRTAAGW